MPITHTISARIPLFCISSGFPTPVPPSIDIDNNREIIFGDELTIDAIVWMGTQPTLKEKSEAAGITEVRPFKEIETYLKNAQQKGQPIHYLPTYRAEHQIKLFQWLGVVPGAEKPSVPFIMGVVNQRNYKSEEEIAEIEKACIVTETCIWPPCAPFVRASAKAKWPPPLPKLLMPTITNSLSRSSRRSTGRRCTTMIIAI